MFGLKKDQEIERLRKQLEKCQLKFLEAKHEVVEYRMQEQKRTNVGNQTKLRVKALDMAGGDLGRAKAIYKWLAEEEGEC